jgi:hypothetical protein
MLVCFKKYTLFNTNKVFFGKKQPLIIFSSAPFRKSYFRVVLDYLSIFFTNSNVAQAVNFFYIKKFIVSLLSLRLVHFYKKHIVLK